MPWDFSWIKIYVQIQQKGFEKTGSSVSCLGPDLKAVLQLQVAGLGTNSIREVLWPCIRGTPNQVPLPLAHGDGWATRNDSVCGTTYWWKRLTETLHDIWDLLILSLQEDLSYAFHVLLVTFPYIHKYCVCCCLTICMQCLVLQSNLERLASVKCLSYCLRYLVFQSHPCLNKRFWATSLRFFETFKT